MYLTTLFEWMTVKQVMYTIRTTRGLVQIPYDALTATLGTSEIQRSPVSLPYTHALELKAYVNGETTSETLIAATRDQLSYDDEKDYELNVNASLEGFTFVCRDGPIYLTYNKATLSRHFGLIEAYTEDYPEETSIPLLDYTKLQVREAVDGHFRGTIQLTRVLDLVTLLTPHSPWSYFDTYTWRGMKAHTLLQLSRQFTHDDLASFIEAHQHHQHEPPMLRGGPGYSILSHLDHTATYCNTDVDEALKLFPASLVFALSNNAEELLENDFSVYAGLPSNSVEESITKGLYDAVAHNDEQLPRSSLIRIMSMLGLKSELLGNMSTNVFAPYQIVPNHYHYRMDEYIDNMSMTLTDSKKERQALKNDLKKYIRH